MFKQRLSPDGDDDNLNDTKSKGMKHDIKGIKFMNGKGMLEPYSFIRVDNFYKDLQNEYLKMQYGLDANTSQTIFVLTHMHYDHLGGLTKNYAPLLDWNYGPIYCTEVTYELMMLRFQNLKPYLRPVKYN